MDGTPSTTGLPLRLLISPNAVADSTDIILVETTQSQPLTSTARVRPAEKTSRKPWLRWNERLPAATEPQSASVRRKVSSPWVDGSGRKMFDSFSHIDLRRRKQATGLVNFKHYFPTFRTRWLFLGRTLRELGHVESALHIGCGEGDHDGLLKLHASRLVACDLNPRDVEHARLVNRKLTGVHYQIEDATALTLPDASFEVVVCMEVIEHVENPRRLLGEIARVLTPWGRAILTCPSQRFPLTYDPLNFALARFGTHLPVGAYAYGHDWLVAEETLDHWLSDANLRCVRREYLTGWLASAAECYWLGLVQRAMKANARNTGAASGRGLRPLSDREPPGVGLVDAFISADRRLQRSSHSVGLGYLLERA